MIDKPTICGFCSCGCALYVKPKNGRVAGLSPSANHPVSTSRLCMKGWNAVPVVMGAERLRTPLVRKSSSLEPASWQEAISLTAKAIKQAGPAAVGVIGSAKTTNEEAYSLVKLARAVIGTSNIDGASRFYDASLIPALLETTGLPASQIDLNSLREAGSMLVVGANVMDQLGHVATRIEDAKLAGCKVVTVDPRISRMSAHSTLFLKPKPGTDLVWLRAMVKIVIDRGLYVESAPQIEGFEELRTSLEDVDLSRAEADCGISANEISEAAEMLAKNSPLVVMFGLGVFQQAESTRVIKALADLALLLGGSVLPLRGQNNAQGACDMGLAHDLLPGYGKVADTAARAKWDSILGCRLPAAPGMSAVDMIRAADSGEIKTMLIFGENVALSAPNTEQSLAALDKVDFLAVSELFVNETANLADVIFPACSFLEKDGTFTNIERRVQRVRRVFEPVGESKSDLAIISELASALGGKLDDDPASVFAEITANVPQYASVSWDALDAVWGEQWPTNGASARLALLPAACFDRLSMEPEGDYQFRLIASRINFHQQTGTMAVRTPVLAREYPDAVIELNEADAEALRLRPGRLVTVSSASGSLTRMLMLSGDVPRGCVHVPHFFGGDSPNMLASYTCDAVSGVPVYKGLPVKVEAAQQ